MRKNKEGMQTNLMLLQVNHMSTLKDDLCSCGKQCFDRILRQKDPYTNSSSYICLSQEYRPAILKPFHLNTRVEQLSKYIGECESQVSRCQRKRIQIGERLQ